MRSHAAPLSAKKADQLVLVASLLAAVSAIAVYPSALGRPQPWLTGTHLAWWLIVLPFAVCDGIELRFQLGRSNVFATLLKLAISRFRPVNDCTKWRKSSQGGGPTYCLLGIDCYDLRHPFAEYFSYTALLPAVKASNIQH